MVLSKNSIYPKIILYVDNEPRCFIGRHNETNQAAQVALKRDLYYLSDLLGKKCEPSPLMSEISNSTIIKN